MKKLIDPHGRTIHKLRLSLLDACNLRCLYCMPEEAVFMNKKNLLTRDEIFSLCKSLTTLGIDEIRVTGGEPTLRDHLMKILEDLSTLPLTKLGLTSNGVKLFPLLPQILKNNCHHINISLDSLNQKNFIRITGRDYLKEVLTSILSAKELGAHVKINMVAMKGINDHEIKDFVEFSGKYDIEVRFLELMKIGTAIEKFNQQFISAEEMISLLDQNWKRTYQPVPHDSTSFNFNLSNGAKIGFIASESKPFCGGCSRLRLGPEGKLRPCLMINQGISLKNKSLDEISLILKQVMSLKPIDRVIEVKQDMYQIGG